MFATEQRDSRFPDTIPAINGFKPKREKRVVNYLRTLAISAFTVPTMIFAADTPPTVEAPKESCANIEWNSAFLKEYPTAAAACRQVIVKDGVKFATFDGKVAKVGSQFVEVAVSDVAGTAISTIAFQIGKGGRVTINDKVEKVKDLKVGDQLTFWVREGRFGISPTLSDQPMTIIKPEAMPAT
jgi:hypothetical protein